MIKWSPIGTAPKDRTVLLAFRKADTDSRNRRVALAYYDEYYAPGGYGHTGGSAWVLEFAGEPADLHYSGDPTHWAEAPEPPQED